MATLFPIFILVSIGTSMAGAGMRGGMIAGDNSIAIGWFIHGLGMGVLLTAAICRFSSLVK